MIIKKTAVGNKDEAFIENNFADGFNIISSDDNNKGKTIEIQSMMYALGNEPTFPVSFEYKKYYHYIEFEENETSYSLCRFNDTFILKYNTNLMIFDSVSELKRYWNKYIFKMPTIIKNQVARIVDPVLFFQIFFVGQDKNDTSNIAHSGFYNKADFYNMLYDICDIGGVELDEEAIQKMKLQIKSLKNERDLLIKQYKILQSSETPVSYLSALNDKESFAQKIADMESIQGVIAELKKSRNLTATRKSKWETTLKELNSLNRTIEHGELRCMDCESTNISFYTSKRNSYAFDVSSTEMRNEIISSIQERIEAYTEEITKITLEINNAQEELQSIMNDDDITLESIVAYKQDVFSAADAEEKIKEIDEKLHQLKDQLMSNTGTTQDKKQKQEELVNTVLEEIKTTYKQIDPTGNLEFDNLFTKRDEVYSGSESTIFLLSKLYAFCKVLQHNYPIIVDSFRAEELSSSKEKIVIELYKKFANQIIFTATLKNEELGKYDNDKTINHIDYKNHVSSKMLSKDYVTEFIELLKNLSIKL